jgi:tetratricopeptide (TPR) repeat protein
VRYLNAILVISAAIGPAASAATHAETAAQWAEDGHSLFLACEFKRATRAFEKALVEQPDSGALHFWLGKSYARMAEVSSPLFAPRNARKARRSLEQAVKIDPLNYEYVRELFDFYVDSPEWFSGGLERAAALLERVSPGETGVEPRLQQIADSRKEHSGSGWWIRRAVLRSSGAVGFVAPETLR